MNRPLGRQTAVDRKAFHQSTTAEYDPHIFDSSATQRGSALVVTMRSSRHENTSRDAVTVFVHDLMRFAGPDLSQLADASPALSERKNMARARTERTPRPRAGFAAVRMRRATPIGVDRLRQSSGSTIVLR